MKSVKFLNGDNICALGQGTWTMGHNPFTRKEETRTLLTGLDLGMTLIDTAEMYENEEFVGNALGSRRHEAFVVSKVLPDNASYEGTIQACVRSLRKLRTDYLDLYLLHWSGAYPLAETVRALSALQHQGKIRMWGVSNLDIDQMQEIATLSQASECAADEVLYNLGERGTEFDLLPYCAQAGIPVIAYSPIGQGVLLHHPTLLDLADKHSATPAQIALAWTIRRPGVLAIPKASTIEHVQDNFNSLKIRLTPTDLALLDRTFPAPRRKVELATI